MTQKLLLTVCIAATLFLGLAFFSQGKVSLGSLATGQTAKYATASSSVYSTSGAMTALATSTSRNRDYFRFNAVSGTAYCLMRNGMPASATDYSFVLSSSTPSFSMENGVYQGRVSCTGTAIFAVVEGNL